MRASIAKHSYSMSAKTHTFLMLYISTYMYVITSYRHTGTQNAHTGNGVTLLSFKEPNANAHRQTA